METILIHTGTIRFTTAMAGEVHTLVQVMAGAAHTLAQVIVGVTRILAQAMVGVAHIMAGADLITPHIIIGTTHGRGMTMGGIIIIHIITMEIITTTEIVDVT